MAKKKPAAMQALDAIKPPCMHCERDALHRIKIADQWRDVCEEHYEEHFRDEAARSCAARGLQRRPDESASDYRVRMSAWFRERAGSAFKRMHHQPKENDA
jgi:hypothetical protein